MKPQIQLRIIVVDPPINVSFAMQRGRSDLLPSARATSRELLFEFPLMVADIDTVPPRFTGEFAQGPPARRFVYVNSGSMAGQPDSCWTRRAKVPLYGISNTTLREVLGREDALLEAVISGRSGDGGPACATVPLLSQWAVKAMARDFKETGSGKLLVPRQKA